MAGVHRLGQGPDQRVGQGAAEGEILELLQQGRPLRGGEGQRHRGGLRLLSLVPQGADQDVDLLGAWSPSRSGNVTGRLYQIAAASSRTRASKGTQTRFRVFIKAPPANTICIFNRKYFY